MDTLILIALVGFGVVGLEIAMLLNRISRMQKDLHEINMKSGWLDNIHQSLEYIENEIVPPGALRKALIQFDNPK
jgi:hypothetical protein